MGIKTVRALKNIKIDETLSTAPKISEADVREDL
jgi:hypothetical protein